MVERGCGENFLGVLEDAAGHGGIAALGRDQLGWVVGSEFFEEEKIGGGRSLYKQLDALADERSYGEELFRRGIKASLFEERLEQRAELLDRQGANMLGVEPDSFRVERGKFRRARGCFIEIDDGVGAVDGLESEGGGELVDREELAVVLGRPADVYKRQGERRAGCGT